MNQAEFARIVSERPASFAWFLGAGASHNANLPTAEDIITDLKRRYYCSEEGQQLSTKDLQNEAVRARVENYMQSRGLPERWSASEYSTYFETIFGDDRERQRAYISAMLAADRVRLAVGNRVFGAMMATGLCRMAFTTNFDPVVEKAVELVQVVQSTDWTGVRYTPGKPAQYGNLAEKPQPYNYPLERGTYLPISPSEALAWSQGSVLGVQLKNPRYNVYKEGALKPTPSPLLLRRFSGDGGWHETVSGILALTKMDWNNNTLYKKLPVTMVYSGRFAEIIQQNPELVDQVFDFRCFM